MKVKAHAKINLGLNVVRKREDGYHELEMVMMQIALHDLIYVTVIESGIEITSNSAIMPTDERNIMYKAAKLMMDTYNIEQGIKIHIYKHIPIQAGLAGGSSDGAAVMRAINELFHLNKTNDELALLGKQIGADVPFCIYEQPAFVSGIGEKLEFLNTSPDCFILLVKPRRGVSTKRSFGMLKLDHEIRPDCTTLREKVEENDYQGIVENVGNTLEGVSMKLVPQIQEIKQKLLDMGFDTALMSGSGSCVFGLTKDEELLENAMNEFRKEKLFAKKTTFYKKIKEYF